MRRNRNKGRLISLFVFLGAICLTFAILLYISMRSAKTSTIVRTDPKVKLSFSWWGNDRRHQYTLDGLDLFMEKHPEIAVDHQFSIWDGFETRMKAAVRSGSTADVMQINYAWLDTIASDSNTFYDLNELKDVIDFDNFSEADLAFGERNGRQVALPIAYTCATVFYNQDLFDRYQLELPKTYDDLFHAAEVMRKDDVYPLTMVQKHVWLLLISWYEQTTGRTVFAEDGTYQAGVEGMQSMLEFYKKLVDEHVITSLEVNPTTLLGEERAAGAICWISDADRYWDKNIEHGETIAIGSVPKVSDEVPRLGWYLKPATMYAISRDCTNPKEAGMLLDFLVNDPDMAVLQGTEKGVPISKGAHQVLEDKGILSGLQSSANDNLIREKDGYDVMIPAIEDSALMDSFKQTADKYLYEKENLTTCAEEIVQSFQRIQQGEN